MNLASMVEKKPVKLNNMLEFLMFDIFLLTLKRLSVDCKIGNSLVRVTWTDYLKIFLYY